MMISINEIRNNFNVAGNIYTYFLVLQLYFRFLQRSHRFVFCITATIAFEKVFVFKKSMIRSKMHSYTEWLANR